MRRTKNLLALIAAGLLAGTASIYAQTELINPTTKAWKYSADNTDQYAAGFPNVDDSAWPEGLGLFGTEPTAYRYPILTPIPAQNAGGPTVSYFRTRFNWAGTPGGVVLTMTNFIDDGIIIFLNGTEITRWNVTDATHTQQAVGANPGGEPVTVVHQIILDSLTNGLANPLITGENVLAVSVHQAGTTSSDIVFGLSVHGSQIIPPCIPTVAPATTTTVECRNVTLTATLAASCGIPSPSLQWAHNGVDIPGANGLSLTVSNVTEASEGNYTITASNPGGSQTSVPVTITVNPDTAGPQVVNLIARVPAGGAGGLTEIVVTLDEAYLPLGGADDAFTWGILTTGGGAGPGVLTATAIANEPNKVLLALDAPLDPGAGYTYVTIQDITDACNNDAVGVTVAGVTGPILVESRIVHWTDARNWRYNQSGADQGTAWRAIAFDDSSWDVGPQGFGNEGNTFPDAPDSQRTPLTRSATQITYYFRTTFRVPTGATGLYFQADVDDGAAVYVNGTEIGRVNIAPGLPLAFDTFTPNVYDPEGIAYMPPGGLPIPDSLLIPGGDNVLAIEVHQVNATSSDVLMLSQIIGAVPSGAPVDPPTIATQPSSVAVTEGRTFSLSVLAAPAGVSYQWTKDGVDIPGANSATYTATADATSGGVYRVRVSNNSGTVTSDPATVVLRRLVLAHGSTWKYETNCQDGVNWSAPGFNDTAWQSGPAPLGIETTAATLARIPAIATVFPTAPSPTFLTSYFRSSVTVPAIGAGESLYLTHIVDDGAAFYIDGNLAFTYNMSGGLPIDCLTLAPGAVPGDGDAREVTVPIVLAAGTHSLAAEVHQNSGTSSDIVFSMEISRGPAMPRLTITHPTATTVVVSWTPTVGVRLFESATVNGNFTAVAGNPQGSFTYTLPVGNTQRFFRLGF